MNKSKFKIIFDNYLEQEEYDSYEEALEAADEMSSNFQLGASILYEMNPGDYKEENDGNGSYTIIEIDEAGNEINRY